MIDYNKIQSLGIQVLDYEQSSIEKCKDSFKDALVFDLGAHNGLWSLAALQAGAKKVYAFEGEEVHRNILKRNLADFLGKYEVIITYIWNKSGFRFVPEREFPPKFRHATALDDYITVDDKTFLKVDIEGSEVQGLEGAKRLITTTNPDMMIEVHRVYGRELKDIVPLIKSWTGREPTDVYERPELYHVYYLNQLK